MGLCISAHVEDTWSSKVHVGTCTGRRKERPGPCRKRHLVSPLPLFLFHRFDAVHCMLHHQALIPILHDRRSLRIVSGPLRPFFASSSASGLRAAPMASGGWVVIKAPTLTA